MKKVNNLPYLLLSFLIFLTTTVFPLSASDNPTGSDVRLALTEFENMDNTGEHDYLSGIISAVLRDDLSDTDGITLLDRSKISAIVNEQKLQISGLFEETEAVEAGKLIGSDYLAGGSFVVIGSEVLLDITIIDVETSQVVSFSSRGETEDIIHIAAEKIARSLTGEKIVFRSADSAVPVLRQSLLPPGFLKLFSPLVDARIYIDDEFYGYTTGEGLKPIEIELPPGRHSIETDLGNSFGIVIEPEIRFEHWEKDFTIRSGKTVVLEDSTRHFNSSLYRIQKILYQSESFYGSEENDYHNEWDFNFRNREGQSVKGSLTLHLLPQKDGGLHAEALFIYNEDRKVHSIDCAAGEKLEFKESSGLLDLDIDIDCRTPDRVSASWSLFRNDVYQGMFRDESN